MGPVHFQVEGGGKCCDSFVGKRSMLSHLIWGGCAHERPSRWNSIPQLCPNHPPFLSVGPVDSFGVHQSALPLRQHRLAPVAEARLRAGANSFSRIRRRSCGSRGCLYRKLARRWPLGVSANQVVHPSCSGKLKARPNSFQRDSPDEPSQFWVRSAGRLSL